MRNIFKFLMMGLMMVAFVAGTATSSFAQTEQETLYKTFTDNRKGPEVEKVQVAIKAGEEFVQKFGSEEAVSAQVAYINKQLPVLKDYVVKVGEQAVFKQFDADVNGKNWDQAFTTGKNILAKNPDNVDVMLVLASIGFDNAAATPPVDKYNTDTINIAKSAIQALEANKASGSGNYGALAYTYKNAEYPDGKNNALGWMYYTVGYINYTRLKNTKEALPYLYKATQVNSATKNFNTNYRYIGAHYVDEFNALAEKVKANNAKIEEFNKVSSTAGKTDEEKNKAVEDAKVLATENDNNWAMQKGYLERAIDAYSRASKAAAADKTTTPAYRKSLDDRVQELYELRFAGKKDGTAAFTASLTAKPFPDPASPVTPIVEAPTTTSTATGSMATVAPAADTAKTNTAATTTPKTAAPVKTAATTTAAPAKTATTTPAAKTPAPKKGNR